MTKHRLTPAEQTLVSFSLSGELVLQDNEGGFSASTISIDGMALDQFIANNFGGRVYRNCGTDVEGRFRITVDRIDE